jgi:hypothetical protein
MERHYDNNPWADKLSQVSLPDSGEAWKSMELLLDNEMPVARKRDKRRWFLLILLLLLLIGVCNCPGRGRLFGDRSRHGSKDSISDAGREHGPMARGGEERPEHAGEDTLVYADRGTPGRGGMDTGGQNRDIEEGKRDIDGKGQGAGGKGRFAGRKKSGGSLKHTHKIVRDTPGDRVPGDDVPGDHVPGDHAPADRVPGDGSIPGKGSISGKDSTILTKKPAVKKDSVHKIPAKSAPKPAEEKKPKEKGWWTAGIGLNQFFTVGGQQTSHYNSGGISGTLGDYIPVPVIQYHFNRKFYLQLEAQLNSPQYTKKDLIISRPPLDSLSPVQKRQSTVFIKKLFYFNLPLSIHYNVYRGLNLGAGLQFSRLSNGIGLYEDKYLNSVTGSTDTTTSVAKSVKSDSVYKKIKTDEFRFLFDASYTWKHFIFGLRYNQALSKFIDVQITPGQVTQGRNSSLQLYMRYILWDSRKKPADLTK